MFKGSLGEMLISCFFKTILNLTISIEDLIKAKNQAAASDGDNQEKNAKHKELQVKSR